MFLEKYPMDNQTCNLIIGSCKYSVLTRMKLLFHHVTILESGLCILWFISPYGTVVIEQSLILISRYEAFSDNFFAWCHRQTQDQ